MEPKNNSTLIKLIQIFGKNELAGLFRGKIIEFQQPQWPRFTPAQREYLTFRLGEQDARRVIALGEDLKKIKQTAQLAYWCSFYLRVTEPPDVPKSNWLSPETIQRAREYPTHELYSGRLTRSRSSFRALCPFHEERTPSFYFYADGSYHCFGACGAHGNNAVDYVMNLEKLDFPSAVRRLS